MAESSAPTVEFDETLIRLEPVRFSETQGEMRLYYADKFLGQYGDTYSLTPDGWVGKPADYWISAAQQVLTLV